MFQTNHSLPCVPVMVYCPLLSFSVNTTEIYIHSFIINQCNLSEGTFEECANT